jgi:hypothetical protein
MDCSVVPLKHQDLFLISTTDYFYPSVEDPYIQVTIPFAYFHRRFSTQGKIGAANVLSDLYAMGIVNCDNVLMILAASTDMNKDDRKIVTSLMIKGFTDQVKDAESIVTGGQTVVPSFIYICHINNTLTDESMAHHWRNSSQCLQKGRFHPVSISQEVARDLPPIHSHSSIKWKSKRLRILLHNL